MKDNQRHPRRVLAGDPTLWLERLASVPLTLFCIGLTMILVFFGTLAQVPWGTYAAQKEIFNSFWVYGTWFWGWKVPIFPGGLSVGALWLVNLGAAFATRFHFRMKDLGLLLAHAGVLLLLVGQLLTQMAGRETQMPVEVGQTRRYSEDPRAMEMALINVADPNFDEVTSIPESIFSRQRRLAPPGLPFTLEIKKFYRNARLGTAPGGAPSLATQGIGTRIAVEEAPPTSSEEEINNVSAFVEVRIGDRSLGTWLVSSGLGAPQSFQVQGHEYRLAIRSRRHYFPFALTLKEFRHDVYPGTDIPKNFSSLVHLSHPEKNENRDALIYMNHPLRYEGRTFYQASFGKNDTLSVFQVVENPAWLTPYISCVLVMFGLTIQFLTHLFAFAKEKR